MEYLVLDTEFFGEPWDGELLAVGAKAEGEDAAWVYPERDLPKWVLEALADPELPVVVFTKTDHRWLRLRGFEVAGPVIDVQVMAWAVDELQPLDLDSTVARYTGQVMDKRIKGAGGRLMFRCDDGRQVPLEDAPWVDLAAYCGRDVRATEDLFLALREGLDYDSLRRYWLEDCIPLSGVLVDMEAAGIPVDLEAAAEMCATLEEEMEDLEDRLTIGADLPPGFNIGSGDQVALYLYESAFDFPGRLEIDKGTRADLKVALDAGERPALSGMLVDRVGVKFAHGVYPAQGLGLPVRKWTDNEDNPKPATDAKTLAVHYGDQDWVQDLLAYRKRATVVQTFLRRFPERANAGRIYGRFNQTGTKTGRLSSNGPNLQNIPSRGELGHQVRSLFRAEPGTVFVHGDYSQLEPRLMAHFSQDPLLLRVFAEDKDIYLETAQAVFGHAMEPDDPRRNLMKTYVLAMGYGAGAGKLQELLAVAGFRVSLREVEDTLDALKRVYATYFAWRENTIGDAAEDRYVETLSGHRRRMGRPYAGASWKELGHGERAMANAVIQGSAADVVARTMVRVAGEVPELRLLAQVHDELLWEADAGFNLEGTLARVQRIAQEGHGFNLTVPLKFEPRVIRTWAEGKD